MLSLNYVDLGAEICQTTRLMDQFPWTSRAFLFFKICEELQFLASYATLLFVIKIVYLTYFIIPLLLSIVGHLQAIC